MHSVDESVSAAYHKMNRKLDDIAHERKQLSRQQDTLEEELSTFSTLIYETQDCIARLSGASEEAWKHAMFNNSNFLVSAQAESFYVIDNEIKRIDEGRGELLKQEDDATREYEKVKNKATQEEESTYKRTFL